MIIGVDLDGVIFDSEKEYRIYSELYDLIELNQNSKINNKEGKFQKRFQWTKEQQKDFLEKYQRKIVSEANFMPGAKLILKKLKQEGHKLIIISARGTTDKETIKMTEEILKQNEMDIFDKYYYSTENKEEICVKEKVDIMIDDLYEKCENIAKSKIKTIYLKDAPSYDIEENEYIKVLYNWGEIYRYIKENEKQEKSCGCIIIENDKVLMIKQTRGHWGFPKGHMEKGETEEETALREVKEETNLDVKIQKEKRYVEEYMTDKGNLKEVVLYIATKEGGEIKAQEEEVSCVKWVKLEEAVNQITYESTKELFKKVLKDIK